MSSARPHDRVAHALGAVLLVTGLVISLVALPGPASAADPKTYYVADVSTSGAGGSRTAPLKLANVSQLNLQPGDRVLLRRGDRFDGGVTLSRSGLAGAPVTLGAYGVGKRPVIAGGDGVQVLGNWVVVRGVRVQGASFSGIGITGDHVTVSYSSSTGNAAGIYIRPGADDAIVSHNNVFNNNVMNVNTPGGQDDSGAFGILVRGDRAQVLANTISGHHAWSYDYGMDGSAVEIYGSKDALVADNVASDNNTFSELGNARTTGTTFRGNTVTGAQSDATFVITRGAESNWGPVTNTRVIDNKVTLTGAQSQGFVCHSGCDHILTLTGNDISAVWKVGYADGPVNTSHNTYRVGLRQFTMGPTDVFVPGD